MKINKKITFISLLITVIMLISMTGINQIENKTLDSGNIYLFNRNKNNHFMDLSRNIRTKKKENQKLLSNDKLTSYTPHSPIEVTSNNDFSKLGFPGLGTQNNPYVIEGYNISGSVAYPIFITDTNAYFIVRNNYFTGPYEGIYLLQVENGRILDNTFVNNYVGVGLNNASNIIIMSNTVENYTLDGILSESSSNNIIYKNKFIDYNSYITLYATGIQFENSINCTISLNLIDNHFSNGMDGIILYDSSNNNISSNNVINSSLYEIEILKNYKNFYSENNIIQYNNFINDFNSSLADQDGGNNTFQYNYWSDWTTPDKNNDNLVDNPYQIDGAAKNIDPYPIASLREFTSPIINHPSNISFNKGSKGNTITWTAKDQNPNLYSVNGNGTSFVKNKSWSNGTISVNVDELSLGLHIVTITIYDRSWNFITDSVNVTVFASTKNGFLPFPIGLISFVSVYFILIYTKHNFDKKKLN